MNVKLNSALKSLFTVSKDTGFSDMGESIIMRHHVDRIEVGPRNHLKRCGKKNMH